MRIVLCAYNWIGCAALDILIKNGDEVFVYTHTSPEYLSSLELKCKNSDIAYSLDRISIENLPFKPDLICSIYYRFIIPQNIISLVNGKIFNLHPSLLPKYRGCSSLTWAIINGEKEVGYTYHYLTNIIDSGNIIVQKKIVLNDWDTQQTLYYRVMFDAILDFNNVVKLVSTGFIGSKQIGNPTYYKRECPFNGQISPDWSIDKIERFIRAMTFPPLPYAQFKGKEIKTLSDYLNFFK